MRRLRPQRLVLGLTGAALLLAAGTVGLLAVRWLAGRSVAPQECARTVPLAPRSEAGPPWQQHRHALVPAAAVPDGLSYLIWNQRSGEMFDWGLRRRSGRIDHFLVPTRYAQVLNRGWEDDPWRYCLVLEPHPPFRFDKNGFVTSTVVRPVSARPGDTIAATVTVEPERTAIVSILVSVVAPDGTAPAQEALPERSLSAGTPAEYDLQVHLPPDAAEGVYVIKVGLFSPDRASLLHWNDGTAVFLVTGRRDSTATGP